MIDRQALPQLASTSTTGRGREAQKRRTRTLIVDSARRLIGEGNPAPTIDAIAAAADVSRRTVYLYFPSLDQLLLDATLGALSQAYVDSALDSSDGVADVHQRVDALVRATLAQADATLPLGRQIIRLTVGQEPATDAPRRGQRRLGWIESAVEPIADRLTEEQRERLVSGLAVLIGFEAMVVLRDITGLDPEREAAVVSWASRSLVDAILAEQTGSDPAS